VSQKRSHLVKAVLIHIPSVSEMVLLGGTNRQTIFAKVHLSALLRCRHYPQERHNVREKGVSVVCVALAQLTQEYNLVKLET